MKTKYLALSALVMASSSVFACTGFYAGKQVTDSGHVLIGRTIDSPSPLATKCFTVQGAVSNAPGRVYASMRYGAGMPLPADTYRFFGNPRVNMKEGGRWDSVCLNEKGLALTGTVTAYPSVAATNADPYVAWGFAEDSLPGYIAMTCATALEAVETVGKVLSEVGHRGGEIYMFVDPKEAWYVEVYTGHHWAAVKMPEDKVAVFGNEFSLRSFDEKSPDTRCSPGLVKFAEEHDFIVRGEDGFIDLAKTFARPRWEFTHIRTWYGHRALAPASVDIENYRDEDEYPLFFTPEHKVSVSDFAELMRTRYEDTKYCPEKSGRLTRIIGTVKQSSCHIIDYDQSLPAPFGATAYLTPAHSEHTPFLPVNAAMTRVSDEFAADRTDCRLGFRDYLAAHHFRRLACLAGRDRQMFGDGVRKYWKDAETKWMKDFGEVVRTLDPQAITDYSVRVQRESLADCKRIFDDLAWHIVEHSWTLGDANNDGSPIVQEKPFVPTR